MAPPTLTGVLPNSAPGQRENLQLPKCSASTPTSGPLPMLFLLWGWSSSFVTQAALTHPFRLKQHSDLNTCPDFPARLSSDSLCSRSTWNPLSSKGAFAKTRKDSPAPPSLLPSGVTSSRKPSPPSQRELGGFPGLPQPSGCHSEYPCHIIKWHLLTRQVCPSEWELL